jgi:hypothetical protein
MITATDDSDQDKIMQIHSCYYKSEILVFTYILQVGAITWENQLVIIFRNYLLPGTLNK